MKLCFRFGNRLKTHLTFEENTNFKNVIDKLNQIKSNNHAQRLIGQSLIDVFETVKIKNVNRWKCLISKQFYLLSFFDRPSILFLINGGISEDEANDVTKFIRKSFTRVQALTLKAPKIRSQLSKVVSLPYWVSLF